MADENEQEEGAAAPKSKKKLFIILGAAILLVVLIGGGAGAYFFLFDKEPAEPVRQEAIYTKVRTLEGRPSFVASLQAEGGSRHFMQIYVEAKSRDQKVADALDAHMPLIVARLNALFTTQSVQRLRTVEGKRALKSEGTELVQQIMMEKIGEPGIETLLFTDFVMQ
ncbi:flagellar basal body-associated FliL family protein [Nitrincola alkalilacustris]|uniref:flagellar basal body-associated FliL family protein n=1 Tax=Nitrincola alkalilacustris TaxID=1571224 RepID=UPI00124F4010|nr:flagellar basal body-associated FliL family protein [Nitrincola alkalilacustris]